MNFKVLTIFPELFKPFTELGLVGRAVKEGKISIDLTQLRDFAINNQAQIDDTPFGGGAGMVLRPEPAIEAIKSSKSENSKVILFTPRGRTLDHSFAKKLSQNKDLTLLCTRYEGVDQRVVDNYVDYEVSMGDYVLMGGELPAMTFIECLSRFVPGVLGNSDSLLQESFTDGLLEYPQYTKPREYLDMKVPEVLFSGNHKNINSWKEEKSISDTKERRMDLFQEFRTKNNVKLTKAPISVALVHYPVLNKEGRVITSSITNLDMHDIARSSRTYGIENYFLVHPTKAMRKLMDTIAEHWDSGYGSKYNPNRKEALSSVRVVPDFEDVVIQLQEKYSKPPKIIVTSAKRTKSSISFAKMREILANNDEPYLIVYGTGWGLTDSFIERADYMLEPVGSVEDFKHLSVRSAAAIVMDRLFGV